jgi:hypothetical protein
MTETILKNFLQTSTILNKQQYSTNETARLFDNVSPFTLFNIIGKNDLFFVAILLLIFYAWFIRFEIRLGAVFGFFFLGFVYYIYYNYKYYNIRDFTVDKNNKDAFLSKILSDNNLDAIEGTVIYGKYSLEFPIGGESVSYMNMNPAGVDFYYNSRDFIQYSYLNYKNSLVAFNYMTKLYNEILFGLKNRGGQYKVLLDLREECLNSWHSILYKLPSSEAMNEKHRNGTNILGELTQNYVDEAQKKIEQQNAQNGINTEYFPIVKTGPTENDTGAYGYNSHYNVF